MALGDGTLSTETHRILRIYEMFFTIMFRFMEEYGVKDLGKLMIITTIAIARANKIHPDIETISEETEIPYSTVRRKIEKLCDDGILVSKKEDGKIYYSISDNVDFAHPDQSDEKLNKNFQGDVLDAVVKSLTAIILDRIK